MPLKITTHKHINSFDLDELIRNTYGRPHCFQQQDGCRDRGIHHVTIPTDADDFEATEVPEEINGEKMGVSFEAWLARDPKAPVGDRREPYAIDLFWERNFYPDLGMVLNDLHTRGLLEAGDYVIVVDWRYMITIPITISGAALAKIIAAAVRHGSVRWCTNVDYPWVPVNETPVDLHGMPAYARALLLAGRMSYREQTEDGTLKAPTLITRSDLQRALAHLSTLAPETFGRLAGLGTDRWDDHDADLLLQLAAFGHERYPATPPGTAAHHPAIAL